jgi:hypothetical protein
VVGEHPHPPDEHLRRDQADPLVAARHLPPHGRQRAGVLVGGRDQHLAGAWERRPDGGHQGPAVVEDAEDEIQVELTSAAEDLLADVLVAFGEVVVR